jgi:hypothetical protein
LLEHGRNGATQDFVSIEIRARLNHSAPECRSCNF